MPLPSLVLPVAISAIRMLLQWSKKRVLAVHASPVLGAKLGDEALPAAVLESVARQIAQEDVFAGAGTGALFGALFKTSLADTICTCQRCAPFMESFVSARRLLRANRTIDHFMAEADRKALDGQANAEASSVRQVHEHLLASLEHQGDNLQDVRAFEQRHAAQSRPLAYYFWTRRLFRERHQTYCTGPHAYPDCPSAKDMQVCPQEQ
jgi:hypothetical protein